MKKETLTAIIVILATIVVSFLAGYGVALRSQHTGQVTVTDTTIYVDTIPYYQPVPKDSAVIRYITRVLPTSKTDTISAENYAQNNGGNIPPLVMSDERDSAAVVIPITQKRYDGEDYRAYVSGYEPSLDSIFVFPKTTLIRERSYKPPNRLGIGITAGYGYGFKSRQAEPYIGIGITYNLINIK